MNKLLEESIVYPKALNGDRVYVHNYKKKRKDSDGRMVDAGAWEWATVERVQTGWYRDKEGNVTFTHVYDVVLDRTVQDRCGEWHKRLRLTVCDDKLQIETWD